MNPVETYLEIFDAMTFRELENAREMPVPLEAWFNKDGFYPHQMSKEAMHAYTRALCVEINPHAKTD
jgi:hypothetical protein